jgi:hypothetical protein
MVWFIAEALSRIDNNASHESPVKRPLLEFALQNITSRKLTPLSLFTVPCTPPEYESETLDISPIQVGLAIAALDSSDNKSKKKTFFT